MRNSVAVLCLLAACATLEDGAPDAVEPSCTDDIVAAATLDPAEGPKILGVCRSDEGLHLVFAVFDASGQAIDDLAAGEARFTVAQLTSAGPQTWQSHVTRVEVAGVGDWPGTTDAVQATTENAGALEPRGGGVYVYTFSTDIAADPSYDGERVHRVGLELRGAERSLPARNPTYDWIPATGAAAAVTPVVTTENCNTCHGALAVHGGARTELGYCVTCHNPGSSDAQSGNTIDFAVMVHEIHRGSQLPSVVAGGEYAIWGFNNSKNDYSHATFPQDVRNCARCHVEAPAGETPSWQAYPNRAACGSCHDLTSFEEPAPAGLTPHPGGPRADDSLCSACHTPEAIEVAHRAEFPTPHNPNAAEGAPVFRYELLALANAVGGGQPAVTFRILEDGAPFDVQTLAEGVAYGPRFLVAWSAPEGTVAAPDDFNNVGSGRPHGLPAQASLDAALAASLVVNGDGSYTTPAGALGTLPADVTQVLVALESGFTVNGARRSGDTVTIAADGVTPRRQLVSIDSCNVCHERLALHGGSRVNNPDECVLCHNPNNTDLAQRPATLDADADGNPDAPAAVGADGLRERPIDFRELIHRIHAGSSLAQPYVVYGFGRSVHDYSHVTFPRRLSECSACHLEGTWGLPLDAGALATTKATCDPASFGTPACSAGPEDDLNVSPAGAACAGCHDSPAALAHTMTSSAFYDDRLHGTEADSCAICHGPGETWDVYAVHPGGD